VPFRKARDLLASKLSMIMTPDPSETASTVSIPLIGETAPAFKAHTTQGPIEFPKDYHSDPA